MAKAERRTVDLSGYPDMVVIYLGQRVNSPKGLWTALKLGRPIARLFSARGRAGVGGEETAPSPLSEEEL